MQTTYDDKKRVAVLSGGQTIHAIHKSTQCYGEVCPVHNPSDHHLKDEPLTYDFMVGSFFRVVGGKWVVDPDDYNFNKYGEVILENSIRCDMCNTTAISTHRHHMAYCACGESAADGGSAYLRRLGSHWTETSVIFRKDV